MTNLTGAGAKERTLSTTAHRSKCDTAVSPTHHALRSVLVAAVGSVPHGAAAVRRHDRHEHDAQQSGHRARVHGAAAGGQFDDELVVSDLTQDIPIRALGTSRRTPTAVMSARDRSKTRPPTITFAVTVVLELVIQGSIKWTATQQSTIIATLFFGAIAGSFVGVLLVCFGL